MVLEISNMSFDALLDEYRLLLERHLSRRRLMTGDVLRLRHAVNTILDSCVHVPSAAAKQRRLAQLERVRRAVLGTLHLSSLNPGKLSQMVGM
jgi:hypothetical protein